MIVGIGTDLVEIDRMERAISRHPHRLVQHVFTEMEQQECRDRRRPAMHYAARFAAKEAFLKAVGLGLRGGMRWKDIGVVHAPSGRPGLVVQGRAAERLRELGVVRTFLSLTHTDHHASAIVILEGNEPVDGSNEQTPS